MLTTNRVPSMLKARVQRSNAPSLEIDMWLTAWGVANAILSSDVAHMLVSSVLRTPCSVQCDPVWFMMVPSPSLFFILV